MKRDHDLNKLAKWDLLIALAHLKIIPGFFSENPPGVRKWKDKKHEA